MSVQIQFRRGTASQWASANPVLSQGEPGIETDEYPHKFKIGDGVTPWNSLTYGGVIGPAGPQGPTGPQGPQGPQGPPGTLGNLNAVAPLIYDLNTNTLSLENPMEHPVVIDAGNF